MNPVGLLDRRMAANAALLVPFGDILFGVFRFKQRPAPAVTPVNVVLESFLTMFSGKRNLQARVSTRRLALVRLMSLPFNVSSANWKTIRILRLYEELR